MIINEQYTDDNKRTSKTYMDDEFAHGMASQIAGVMLRYFGYIKQNYGNEVNEGLLHGDKGKFIYFGIAEKEKIDDIDKVFEEIKKKVKEK